MGGVGGWGWAEEHEAWQAVCHRHGVGDGCWSGAEHGEGTTERGRGVCSSSQRGQPAPACFPACAPACAPHCLSISWRALSTGAPCSVSGVMFAYLTSFEAFSMPPSLRMRTAAHDVWHSLWCFYMFRWIGTLWWVKPLGSHQCITHALFQLFSEVCSSN